MGSIGPTSNIGTGGATPAPPTPITYLTQWEIVGNSEVHGNEIWSCGEYNPIDGKWHILVQPQGGSIADIALDEPLRKVNNVADSIEFPSETEGKALVTRNIASVLLKDLSWGKGSIGITGKYRCSSTSLRYSMKAIDSNNKKGNLLCAIYNTITASQIWNGVEGIAIEVNNNTLSVFDENYTQADDKDSLIASWGNAVLIYELATPTTELVDAPQIAEAESYSMIISQGAKAVSWSSFETDSE